MSPRKFLLAVVALLFTAIVGLLIPEWTHLQTLTSQLDEVAIRVSQLPKQAPPLTCPTLEKQLGSGWIVNKTPSGYIASHTPPYPSSLDTVLASLPLSILSIRLHSRLDVTLASR